jgi:hypothetical protein
MLPELHKVILESLPKIPAMLREIEAKEGAEESLRCARKFCKVLGLPSSYADDLKNAEISSNPPQ